MSSALSHFLPLHTWISLPLWGIVRSHLLISSYQPSPRCASSNLYRFRNSSDVQELLPYVARHVHGPQDTQPLQSVLIRNNRKCVDILAWPVPDIDVEVHDTAYLARCDAPYTRGALL